MDIIPKREEIDCFYGVNVRIEYLGQFRFERINLHDEDGNLLYYLEKEISPKTLEDEKVPRREYDGNGKLIRRYVGWRKSFIEFCRKLQIKGKDPSVSDYYAIAREFRIKLAVVIRYALYYEKLFVKKGKI